MKKTFLFLLMLLPFVGARANDGVYYASGNQLIPITETDISVKKEILTVNRVGDHLEVTVYYEFFNPAKPKDLLVGFEAPAPYPAEEDYMKLFPEQPHMRNFKVIVNGEPLKYEIAHVEGQPHEDYTATREYYSNGKFQDLSRKQCVEALEADDYFFYPFYFVYHFNAHFREGLNIVQHTYDFDMSSSVEDVFSFDYILTAANRWANNGIDDFTLNIDMGPRESFEVYPSFFKDASEWTINGRGKVTTDRQHSASASNPVFHMQEGSVTFRKKNFHPEGELQVNKRFYTAELYWRSDDQPVEGKDVVDVMKYVYDDLRVAVFEDLASAMSAQQKRIMKNMPFAYRGHVFKDKGLKDYFESTEWYMPDPDYKDDMTTMNENEKEWIQFWSK